MPEKNETRRELLTKTALLTGAAAFLQTKASADEASMDARIRHALTVHEVLPSRLAQ